MAGDDLRRASETFDQQTVHAVVLNAAMNTTAALEHGQRMNRLAAGGAEQVRQGANAAGIGAAVVALRARQENGALKGRLSDANSSGNASKEASKAGSAALEAACQEIARLSGVPLSQVQAKYNKVRTRVFLAGLADCVRSGSVLPETIQEFDGVAWLDREEVAASASGMLQK